MSRSTNSTWLGTNAWSTTASSGPFNASWADGNTANFSLGTGTYQVNIAGVTIGFGSGGIYRTGGGGNLVILGSGGVLDFNGGTVRGGDSTSAVLRVESAVAIKGNFTYTSGLMQLRNTVAMDGTVTATGGSIQFENAGSSSEKTNVKISGGTVSAELVGAITFGSLNVTDGSFNIGARNNASSVDVTVKSLSGSGGQNSKIQIRDNNQPTSVVHSFTVDQETDTVYGGQILLRTTVGSPLKYSTFTKKGSGSLTFSSIYEAPAGTTVSGGSLLFSGVSTKTFDNVPGGSGSAAITVANGGTLGASTTLTINAERNVVVQQGGILASGTSAGSVGRMTFAFEGGASAGKLDLTAASSADAWLKFDLDADTTAGTTYDQIRLTSGTMEIGSGLLGFNDFSFNLLSGFKEGTYTLFDFTGTGTLSGTLSSSLTGNIGDGYWGSLYLSGNNIMLNVVAVPEPSVGMLGVSGGAGLLLLLRRRRRKGLFPA